jgi:2-polyprenyl-6-methoxyphenol hydroxylase-like FAD-dependent oxidoreductase
MAAVNAENKAVLVAGGGPAGLAAAAELSLHGVGCVVIEPRAQVSHRRPRAKTSSVRTMEHMRRWGVADAVRAAAPLKVAWSQRVTFCESLSGQRITDFDGVFGLTTERDERFAEPGQQVPQPVVEEVLRAHLATLPGVELRLGHTVTELREDAGGVTVTIASGDGAAYQVRARYVLGCDGYAGVTRDCLGAAYAGTSDPRPNFNVVFRAPGLDTPLGPAVQYWTVAAATQGLAGRLDLDGTWWAIMPGVPADYGAAHAGELITGLVGAPFRHELLASDPWTARVLVADRFCSRRVFLVGESAHVNPPYGGHGYNTSIGDAVNIAWKLAFVLRGWAGERLLESYEPERRGVVEETVASAAANMRMLPGDLAAADAAAIRRAKAPEFHNLGLVLGYRYAGSSAVQPGGGGSSVADVGVYTPAAEPGARLPHWWLPDGTSLYDTLGAGFTLVTPAGVGDARVLGFSERARALRLPLTVAVSPPDYPWHGDFLLVRPDQHVAWRADDPAGIDLAAAVGRPAGSPGGSLPWITGS